VVSDPNINNTGSSVLSNRPIICEALDEIRNFDDKIWLSGEQREKSVRIVNASVVRRAGIGDARESQPFDHVIGFECAVDRSHMHAEDGTISETRFANQRAADASGGKSAQHRLGIGALCERAGLQIPCIDADSR
jgi:hypothetical protein